jgi:sugar/nucleoside kinase (ribokinase family)
MNNTSLFDVVGLGTSTVDILSLVDYFPAHEDVYQARAIALDGGGPVATALVTLARLGASTAMIDTVGDDWRGAIIWAGFEQEGVCTDYLQTRPGRVSATSAIMVRQSDGARVIVFAPGEGAELGAEDLPPGVMERARFLHVNGRHWEACLAACRLARQAGVPVSFDGGAQRYRPALRELVPLTDICIVARDFAQHYTGASDMGRAGELLLAEGPQLAAITDGVNGSWVLPRNGEPFHQPAFLLPRVVDTTGCGDSYHGAFLFGLLQGLPLRQTTALAAAVAALNTRRLGGRAALPTLAEATAFLRERGISLTD